MNGRKHRTSNIEHRTSNGLAGSRTSIVDIQFVRVLTAGLLIFGGCARQVSSPNADPPEARVDGETVSFPTNAPQLASISVETAEPRKIAVSHVTGRVYWNDDLTVRVFTPVAGRVTHVLADISQEICSNQPLAEIDSPDFGQALAAAQTAVGNYAAADKAFARTKDLLAHGAAAAKDVEAAEAGYHAAAAERDRSLAQLANFGGNLDSTNSLYLLRSPLAGVLVEKNLTPGQELRPDMMLGNVPQTYDPVFIVSDPTTLWLQLDVAEDDLPELRSGLALRVTCKAFPNRVFDGTLEKIGDTLDPATRTVRVRGVVRNPDRLLKAEMYVLVDVVRETSQAESPAIEVPAQALFLSDNGYCLFVEQSPGQYRRQRVRVGIEKDGQVPVIEGLEAGQRVVTEGALLLDALVEPSS